MHTYTHTQKEEEHYIPRNAKTEIFTEINTSSLRVARLEQDSPKDNGQLTLAAIMREVAAEGNLGKSSILGEDDIFARSEANNSTFVDMGELGTFSAEYPFNYPRLERIYSHLPNKREKINTKFHFFGPSNKNISQNKLKNALLNKNDSNVFIVDWSNGYGELYEQSVANIRVVGAEVGLFMQRLNILNLDPKFLHIIGHGLGAHGAGYAGKWFQERQHKLIGRITGLDPAGPYFNGVNKTVRLDKGDAAFVDVIHTNTEGESIYVEVNPGELNCSHYRSCDYFIATLEEPDCKFESQSCYSWDSYFHGGCGTSEHNACIRMGFYAYADACELQNERSLKLFVKTKLSPPYCYPELSSVLEDAFAIYKEHLLHAYRSKH
ncbi:pancreatic lipase-related protein 2-like [Stegodyphus dumicola]|uniref:pancreatic lipase-related protein 2-like n=1 Tax=Stegodyphus dumicola TaxID=202533 RepID=UPI0015A9D231|nr:pancreatic lipase-related protein 2-like [Stegodyphus dumicola]